MAFFLLFLRKCDFFPSKRGQKRPFLHKIAKFAFLFLRENFWAPNMFFLYNWVADARCVQKTFGFSRKMGASFHARSERDLGRKIAIFDHFLQVKFDRTSFQPAPPKVEKK